MKFLLDTCVVSEIIRPKPNKQVITWIQNQPEEMLYISVLTFAEIEKGIEKTTDSIRRRKLRLWVENDLKKRFKGRIIPIDLNVANKWGMIQAMAESSGKTMPVMDSLIAVSALVYHCVVVTRNTSDMEQSTAELFNPWLDAEYL